MFCVFYNVEVLEQYFELCVEFVRECKELVFGLVHEKYQILLLFGSEFCEIDVRQVLFSVFEFFLELVELFEYCGFVLVWLKQGTRGVDKH